MRADTCNLDWRTMELETLERAYSPSSALDGPIDPFIKAYADKSREAYEKCSNMISLRYGDKSAHAIDFVTPQTSKPVPLMIFIHGGYWQQLSKMDSFFPAPDALSRGMAYAAVDYTLCPDATLDEIVPNINGSIRQQVVSDLFSRVLYGRVYQP